jgi:hypothetical protein
MNISRFVATRFRRIRACLKALIARIDLTDFPRSCCG